MSIKNGSGTKFTAAVGIIFFIVGILFVVIGFAAKKSHENFIETAQQTSATVTDVDVRTERKKTGKHKKTRKVYDIYIEYEVDGVTYEDVYNSSSSPASVGSQIKIYYDPENPFNTRLETSSSGFAILSVIGGVFAISGLIAIFVYIKNGNNKKRLLENGLRLTGTIINSVPQTNVRVNGKNPEQAECEVYDPDTGLNRLYYSEASLKGCQELIGACVDVYVDPNNAEKGYVDLSSARKN